MSDQKQNASEGSHAYQAGGDVVVHQGLTPAQMKQILDAVAAQYPQQAAVAMAVVNGRLADFERRFFETFGDKGAGNKRAMEDPDFLYVLKESQHAYIRSGDEGVRDTLMDLIARRSQEQSRTRLSLTLNNAVEIAAVLTRNEFAELSLSYLLRYTVSFGLRSVEALAQQLRNVVEPLLPDISRENASYQYLEACSCATLNQLGGGTVIAVLRQVYAGLFSQGFTQQDLHSKFDEPRRALVTPEWYCPCSSNPQKLQTQFLNKDELDRYAKAKGWTENEKNSVWGLIDSTTLNGEDLTKRIEPHWPAIRRLTDLWDNTPMGRLNLTTVGIAIGHSNLVRLGKFKADLGIWIK